MYLHVRELKSLYSVLNRKIRSVDNRHLKLRLKVHVCTKFGINDIMILLRKICGGNKMELEIYFKYKLSSDDELCYYLDFWQKNKTNLKCTIKDDMNDYNWMNIIEPTVDEDTIDFSQLEIVTVGQSYDVFTNTVTCRLVLRLELWYSAESDDVLIHKNKLKWNILEWLNGMNGFITLRNVELRYLTDDKMIYGIPSSKLLYDNLDVKYKLRK